MKCMGEVFAEMKTSVYLLIFNYFIVLVGSTNYPSLPALCTFCKEAEKWWEGEGWGNILSLPLAAHCSSHHFFP